MGKGGKIKGNKPEKVNIQVGANGARNEMNDSPFIRPPLMAQQSLVGQGLFIIDASR
jgi:hypothetical protein